MDDPPRPGEPSLRGLERLLAVVQELSLVRTLDDVTTIVRSAARELKTAGAESIAVNYLFSFMNPAHEEETRRIIAEECPDIHVSLSSEVLPRIREWPRTPANDPYQAGVEHLAAALRARLGGARLAIAYNEFCAPSLEEAVDRLVADGVDDVTVVPTMLTPGGSHSEVEIPAALEALRARHPQLTLRYAWPVDVALLADMLAAHLAR